VTQLVKFNFLQFNKYLTVFNIKKTKYLYFYVFKLLYLLFVPDDLKERRGYYHLKKETLDCTMWRAPFGRGFGPVIRQTAK